MNNQESFYTQLISYWETHPSHQPQEMKSDLILFLNRIKSADALFVLLSEAHIHAALDHYVSGYKSIAEGDASTELLEDFTQRLARVGTSSLIDYANASPEAPSTPRTLDELTAEIKYRNRPELNGPQYDCVVDLFTQENFDALFSAFPAQTQSRCLVRHPSATGQTTLAILFPQIHEKRYGLCNLNEDEIISFYDNPGELFAALKKQHHISVQDPMPLFIQAYSGQENISFKTYEEDLLKSEARLENHIKAIAMTQSNKPTFLAMVLKDILQHGDIKQLFNLLNTTSNKGTPGFATLSKQHSSIIIEAIKAKQKEERSGCIIQLITHLCVLNQDHVAAITYIASSAPGAFSALIKLLKQEPGEIQKNLIKTLFAALTPTNPKGISGFREAIMGCDAGFSELVEMIKKLDDEEEKNHLLLTLFNSLNSVDDQGRSGFFMLLSYQKTTFFRLEALQAHLPTLLPKILIQGPDVDSTAFNYSQRFSVASLIKFLKFRDPNVSYQSLNEIGGGLCHGYSVVTSEMWAHSKANWWIAASRFFTESGMGSNPNIENQPFLETSCRAIFQGKALEEATESLTQTHEQLFDRIGNDVLSAQCHDATNAMIPSFSFIQEKHLEKTTQHEESTFGSVYVTDQELETITASSILIDFFTPEHFQTVLEGRLDIAIRCKIACRYRSGEGHALSILFDEHASKKYALYDSNHKTGQALWFENLKELFNALQACALKTSENQLPLEIRMWTRTPGLSVSFETEKTAQLSTREAISQTLRAIVFLRREMPGLLVSLLQNIKDKPELFSLHEIMTILSQELVIQDSKKNYTGFDYLTDDAVIALFEQLDTYLISAQNDFELLKERTRFTSILLVSHIFSHSIITNNQFANLFCKFYNQVQSVIKNEPNQNRKQILINIFYEPLEQFRHPSLFHYTARLFSTHLSHIDINPLLEWIRDDQTKINNLLTDLFLNASYKSNLQYIFNQSPQTFLFLLKFAEQNIANPSSDEEEIPFRKQVCAYSKEQFINEILTEIPVQLDEEKDPEIILKKVTRFAIALSEACLSIVNLPYYDEESFKSHFKKSILYLTDFIKKQENPELKKKLSSILFYNSARLALLSSNHSGIEEKISTQDMLLLIEHHCRLFCPGKSEGNFQNIIYLTYYFLSKSTEENHHLDGFKARIRVNSQDKSLWLYLLEKAPSTFLNSTDESLGSYLTPMQKKHWLVTALNEADSSQYLSLSQLIQQESDSLSTYLNDSPETLEHTEKGELLFLFILLNNKITDQQEAKEMNASIQAVIQNIKTIIDNISNPTVLTEVIDASYDLLLEIRQDKIYLPFFQRKESDSSVKTFAALLKYLMKKKEALEQEEPSLTEAGLSR